MVNGHSKNTKNSDELRLTVSVVRKQIQSSVENSALSIEISQNLCKVLDCRCEMVDIFYMNSARISENNKYKRMES